MSHVKRYRMLEVRRAMRRERIFRNRTNPLEIYDVLELIERFRCNETSVFVVSHVLSNFFLHPEVIDEENLAFKITILFSYSSNNTTVALSVQFGFPFIHLFYFQQPRIVTCKQPELECLPAQSNKSVHYIDKIKRNYQG